MSVKKRQRDKKEKQVRRLTGEVLRLESLLERLNRRIPKIETKLAGFKKQLEEAEAA